MRRVAYFNPPYIKLKHVLTSRVAFVTAGISLNAVICFSSSFALDNSHHLTILVFPQFFFPKRT